MIEICAPVGTICRAARKFRWSWAGPLGAALVILAACSGDSVADAGMARDSDEELAATTGSTTTTSEAPNRPPELRVAPVGRAEIGQRLAEPILAFDPDGDDVVVTTTDGPLGFSPTLNSRGRVTGFEWEPLEPGEWIVEVTGTDPDGATTSTEVLLVARNSRSIDMVLAMGDSIAAGFGRDRSDFLGVDECFRSEESAYGLQAHDALIDVGALETGAEAVLVACAGATTGALMGSPVTATDAEGQPRDGPIRSQLQWAIDLNPTIVTLTIGISDVGLFDADGLMDIAEPESSDALSRQSTMRTNLEATLGELVTATDAHIAITTYYDPTASTPNGIDGCEGECFGAAFADRLQGLNAAIIDITGRYPEGRVSLIRLDGANDVWEAGNATGPDVLRDGLGPLQGLVDQFTGGGVATCSRDGDPSRDLISGLDCVHPNAEGHMEIGRLVVDALLSI